MRPSRARFHYCLGAEPILDRQVVSTFFLSISNFASRYHLACRTRLLNRELQPTGSFLRGVASKRLRKAQVPERDGWRCQCCGRAEGLQVHYLQPRPRQLVRRFQRCLLLAAPFLPWHRPRCSCRVLALTAHPREAHPSSSGRWLTTGSDRNIFNGADRARSRWRSRVEIGNGSIVQTGCTKPQSH